MEKNKRVNVARMIHGTTLVTMVYGIITLYIIGMWVGLFCVGYNISKLF